jgi:hexulose-6-phosphate isomerase
MSNVTEIERKIGRRAFLGAAALATSAVVLSDLWDVRATRVEAAARPQLKKTLKMGMIAEKDASGKTLSTAERLRAAANAGFVSVEPDTVFDAKQLAAIESGARDAGLTVDAIVCSTHWSSPLSDADPAVFEKTISGMRQSLQNAKDLGADMVLLVPAVVNPKVQYFEAWKRSVERVKHLAEDAEKAGITIGIENVWNKFLLSPIEARHYIAEIESERVRFWFDVGNVVLFGYPQDWIRTLGPLIARVDVKDFKSDTKEFVPLLDGSVDWPEVMRAFDEIGYQGYFAAEVQGGDEAYLREYVSQRMDKIIAME